MKPADRYHRQTLLPQIGQSGQARLVAARVLLIGCGALGTVVAEQLARAGVGFLRIADRDIVEMTNLQRQVLFDEADVAAGNPKAAAAVERLGRVNSDVKLEACVVDVDSSNIESLMQIDGRNCDLLIDGTDNVETRYLANDAAVKQNVPWVYGACVATEGRVMTIMPGTTACLRCVFPQPPGAGELPTCDTAGVLASAAGVVASMQSLAAIKLLSGNAGAIAPEMLTFDLWNNRIRTINLDGARSGDCPCCGKRRFEFLDREPGATVRLCGRDGVQVRAARATTLDLADVERRMSGIGVVERTRFLLRCKLAEPAGVQLTVFPDARVLVTGASDVTAARSLVARYVGS